MLSVCICCVTQMRFVPENLLWVMHKFNTHAQDMSTKAEQAAWGLSPTLARVAGTLRYNHKTMEGGWPHERLRLKA